MIRYFARKADDDSMIYAWRCLLCGKAGERTSDEEASNTAAMSHELWHYDEPDTYRLAADAARWINNLLETPRMPMMIGFDLDFLANELESAADRMDAE